MRQARIARCQKGTIGIGVRLAEQDAATANAEARQPPPSPRSCARRRYSVQRSGAYRIEERPGSAFRTDAGPSSSKVGHRNRASGRARHARNGGQQCHRSAAQADGVRLRKQRRAKTPGPFFESDQGPVSRVRARTRTFAARVGGARSDRRARARPNPRRGTGGTRSSPPGSAAEPPFPPTASIDRCEFA